MKLTDLPQDLRVAVARRVAAQKMPYFSAGINALVVRSAPGLGTLAVTPDGVLLVDHEALGRATAFEAAMVLVHEYMHVYLRHSERFERLVRAGAATNTPEDRQVWNHAADCEINDGLVRAGMPKRSEILQGDCVTPGGYGLPDDMAAEWYYGQLKSMAEGAGGAGCCSGRCGSGSGGERAPGEPEGVPERGRLMDVQARFVDEAVQEAQQDRGNGRSRGVVSPPAAVVRQAGERLRPARATWDVMLARLARRAVQQRPGMIDYAYGYPSRQVAAVAHMRPRPVLPAMVGGKAEVVLLFDTSGSMGEADFTAMLAHLQRILQALPGTRLRMVSCDTAVRSDTRVGSVQKARDGLVGGGGTTLSPGMRALERSRPRPDAIVLFTDGYCEPDLYYPPGITVIGVISPGGVVPPGMRLYVQAE